MARVPLDIPKILDWATNASRTITPATAGITEADGWDFSQRPPPRLMNYIHSLQFEAQKRQAINMIGTPRIETGYWAGVTMGRVARTSTGLWITLASGTGNSQLSYDGYVWSAGTSMGAACNGIIRTDTDEIVAISSSNLHYTSDGVTWNTAGTGYSEIANVGTSDHFLVSNAATLEIWGTGIAGGAASPSSTSWGATAISNIAGSTISKWMIVDGSDNGHISTDGGDNWVQTGQGPGDALASFTVTCLDYDGDTAVAGGSVSSVAALAYTNDNGTTWNASTFVGKQPAASTSIDRLIALGNKLWIAVGDDNTTPGYWFSVDDGVNWQLGSPYVTGYNAIGFIDVWCSGDQIMAVGQVGNILLTDIISTIS